MSSLNDFRSEPGLGSVAQSRRRATQRVGSGGGCSDLGSTTRDPGCMEKVFSPTVVAGADQDGIDSYRDKWTG